MRKIKIILIFVLMLSIPIVFSIETKANIVQDSAPYETYTQGPKGLILTQTAYEPTGNLNLEVSLSDPEDFVIKDNFIYVADTAHKRILKYDFEGKLHLEINGFKKPMGITVNDQGYIFVADELAKTVYKYDGDGVLVSEITKPKEALFGSKTPFEPLKVVTGPRDIIYIVGAGSTDGIIQLNQYGEFLGFFAANTVSKSFFAVLSDIFGIKYARNIPISADNLAIDDKGSLFTVSKTKSNKIKKFNISSQVTLSLDHEENLRDIIVNDFGNIYTISDKGTINEYDRSGNLIFQFGALDEGSEILGKFINPVAIDLDDNNNIYILDKGSNSIQILVKSEFASIIHRGLINYSNGIYDVEEWREVLKRNSFFATANSSIANALYRENNFGEALQYFKLAQDRVGYSEAFWQLRYNWFQNYLVYVFIAIIAFFIVKKVLSFVDSKVYIYDPIRNVSSKAKEKKLVRESKYLFKIIRHPIDTVYEIKREQKSSMLTATLIYGLFVVFSIISAYSTNFIFNYNDLTSYQPLTKIFIQVGLILLFVVSNHLISSLQSGEGWFKDIYRTIAFALAPFILTIIPLTLLSHVLTLNEVFIYQAVSVISWGYTFILMIIMIKETHNYTFKQLIINLLLTIFTMLMVILIVFLIYLLTMQLYEYIAGIIKEVILRG